MSLLGAVNYDPAAAVSKSVASRVAMTALDTTNLRLTFTVPANGAVVVWLRGVVHGGSTSPQIFLGVLEGSTVKGRVQPIGTFKTAVSATAQLPLEAGFVVSGLTPGASLTWDAAYAVDVLAASAGIKYGGPDDTTANNAFGGFEFEVWEAPKLLGAKLYDPSTAVTKATTSLAAMTAFDTTNLRITFNAPASGRVIVLVKCITAKANTNQAVVLLGVLDGSTVKGRQSPAGSFQDTAGTANRQPMEASFVVSGLTPGNSYSYDAAYGVEVAGSGGTPVIGYGGPDDTTSDNAYGAFGYEIWEA